jgi:Family of unknown function (DUF6011)
VSGALPLDGIPAGPATGQGQTRCRALRQDRSGPCGRKLQDPASITRGIGPCCWARLYGTPTAVRVGALGLFPAGPGQQELPLDGLTASQVTVVCPECSRLVALAPHGCPSEGLTPAQARTRRADTGRAARPTT